MYLYYIHIDTNTQSPELLIINNEKNKNIPLDYYGNFISSKWLFVQIRFVKSRLIFKNTLLDVLLLYVYPLDFKIEIFNGLVTNTKVYIKCNHLYW